MADNAALPLRLRVRFSKEGRARYISHAEYSRTLMIAARRAGLPLEYAGQKMSRMKISLSPPLPIGITSEGEFVDFNLTSYVPAAEAQKLLNEALPGGIAALEARLLAGDARPVGKVIDTALFEVEMPDVPEGGLRRAAEEFLERDSVPYERVQPRRTRTVDLRPGVHRLEAVPLEGKTTQGSGLVMVLDDGTAGTTKPWEVIEVVSGLAGLSRDTWERATVHRKALFTRRGDRLVSPMEIGRRSASARRGARGGNY